MANSATMREILTELVTIKGCFLWISGWAVRYGRLCLARQLQQQRNGYLWFNKKATINQLVCCIFCGNRVIKFLRRPLFIPMPWHCLHSVAWTTAANWQAGCQNWLQSAGLSLAQQGIFLPKATINWLFISIQCCCWLRKTDQITVNQLWHAAEKWQ